MIVSIRLRTILAILLVLLVTGGIVAGVLGADGGLAAIPVTAEVTPELLAAADGSYIKWVDFNVPLELMKKTLELDIKSQEEDVPLSWIELLAYLGARYGGKYKSFKQKDLDAVAERLRAGETMEEITEGMKYYSYYIEAYTAVLGGLVGSYLAEVPAEGGEGTQWVQKYGLKAFSPIAKGYGFSHYRDFGDGRSYGYNRKHLGNDLMGRVGTPIVAMESGVVEVMGWNMYGGWRIGIRSFDGKRYYYYAHLRKDHPFHSDLYEGKAVTAGEVIGYLGMTGYSTKPNVNNIKKPHLHFGLQLIFDESQKEGTNQIWVDVYALVELLQKNRVQVIKDEEKKEYYRVYNLMDPAVPTNY